MIFRIFMALLIILGPSGYLNAASSDCEGDECFRVFVEAKSNTPYRYVILDEQEEVEVCAFTLSAGQAPISKSGYGYVGRETGTRSLNCSASSNNYTIKLIRLDTLEGNDRFYVCNQYYNQSDLANSHAIISQFTLGDGTCTLHRQEIEVLDDGDWSCHDSIPAGYYIDKFQTNNTCSTSQSSTRYQYRVQKIGATSTSFYSCKVMADPGEWDRSAGTAHSDCLGGLRYRYTRPSPGSPPDGYRCTVPSNHAVKRVVVDSTVAMDCPFGRAYQTEIPKTSTHYCVGLGGVDLPPPGMVVWNSRMIRNCDARTTYSGHAVVLLEPRDGLKVCSNYPRPAGWAIINPETNNSYCLDGHAAELVELGEGSIHCGNEIDVEASLVGDLVVKASYQYSTVCSNDVGFYIGEANRAGLTYMCRVNSDASIPDDFMITHDIIAKVNTSCYYGDPKTIRLPYDGIEVCTLLHMPENYAVEKYVSPNRGGGYRCGNGYYRLELISGGDDYTICADNNIPGGYVVTRVKNYSACPTDVAYEIETPNPNGTTTVCAVQSPADFPPGLVVTGITNSTNCDKDSGESSTAYVSEFADPDAVSTMCIVDSVSPPDGFVETSRVSDETCGIYPQATIMPYGYEDGFIDPFVSAELDVEPASVVIPVYDCADTIIDDNVVNTMPRNSNVCP